MEKSNKMKVVMLMLMLLFGCINCYTEIGTEGGNGTVRFCDFPNYVPTNGCEYPFPNFSSRFNYTGRCEAGTWVIDGPVVAEPKRNITICGSTVKVNGMLIIPSTRVKKMPKKFNFYFQI